MYLSNIGLHSILYPHSPEQQQMTPKNNRFVLHGNVNGNEHNLKFLQSKKKHSPTFYTWTNSSAETRSQNFLIKLNYTEMRHN